jgi:hypothetical protein
LVPVDRDDNEDEGGQVEDQDTSIDDKSTSNVVCTPGYCGGPGQADLNKMAAVLKIVLKYTS